jgi:hypothetical protein
MSFQAKFGIEHLHPTMGCSGIYIGDFGGGHWDGVQHDDLKSFKKELEAALVRYHEASDEWVDPESFDPEDWGCDYEDLEENHPWWDYSFVVCMVNLTTQKTTSKHFDDMKCWTKIGPHQNKKNGTTLVMYVCHADKLKEALK